MRQNIALKIAYDGSEYFGWQKTSLGPSIEATLQKALETILQESISLQAASRTDRGVHAEGQWVNFCTQKNPLPLDLKKRLNCLLPPSVRVLFQQQMPDFFHPTLHADKKEYHYAVCSDPIHMPTERFYSWHVPHVLNFDNMKAACSFFVGKHDFSSFCNVRKNLNYKDKSRLIETVDFSFPHYNRVLFVITGNQFLYKMVRNIVGTLIYVGRGKIKAEKIPHILQKRQRIDAGVTAPAHGLTLKKIYYPQEFNIEL
jgi:tRNA pseudouridine38-40 synthase